MDGYLYRGVVMGQWTEPSEPLKMSEPISDWAIKLSTWLIILAMTFLFLFVLCDCEGCPIEVGPEDNGRMVEEGSELRPLALPWLVSVSEDIDNRDAVLSALDDLNSQLDPVVAFDVSTDLELYDELWLLAPNARVGTVLISQGFAGTPGGLSEDGVPLEDPGGITYLIWDEEGMILAADIVLSSDYTYHWQTTRDVTAHEAGHTLGLAHDDSSLDLGSCMASPPEYDCELTPSDVVLVQEE